MTENIQIDALRRAVAGATIERDQITASAINAVMASLQAGGRIDFTVRDIRALNIVLDALDAVKQASPADYAQKRAPEPSPAEALRAPDNDV